MMLYSEFLHLVKNVSSWVLDDLFHFELGGTIIRIEDTLIIRVGTNNLYE